MLDFAIFGGAASTLSCVSKETHKKGIFFKIGHVTSIESGYHVSKETHKKGALRT